MQTPRSSITKQNADKYKKYFKILNTPSFAQRDTNHFPRQQNYGGDCALVLVECVSDVNLGNGVVYVHIYV